MSNKVKNLLGTVTECVESLDESTSLLQNDTGVTQNNSFASGDHKLLSSSTVSTSNEDNESSQGLSSCITEDVGKAHSQNEESKLSLTSILDLITSRGRKNKPSSRSTADPENLKDEKCSLMSKSSNETRSLSGRGSLSQPPNTGSLCSEDGIDRSEEDSECVFLQDKRVQLGNEETKTFITTISSDNSECQKGVRNSQLLNNTKRVHECPLCFVRQPVTEFPRLSCCNHRSCKECLFQYLYVEIMESRVQITCPECNEVLHPSDISKLLTDHPDLVEKYEQFSLRRVLLTDPDTRWCPAPDCGYAVIASSCAACPQLYCERPGCGTLFCYHCKGPWHANQTCDEARRDRGELFRAPVPQMPSASNSGTLKRGDIKACPRCHTYIVKMNDGSCNHMVCAMCNAEFCWLCLKEINDLHYLSPTGCTFWGKKPWTRKKKLLWQIGTLIGAPVGIALIAGLAIPGIVFGVPVFVGRKVNQRFAYHPKSQRRLLTAGSVIGSLMVSPVLAVMAVGVGVPIMLAYVYGVVPLSLCRNGKCGFGASSSTSDPGEVDDDEIWRGAGYSTDETYNVSREKVRLLHDSERQDGTSVATGTSINSTSQAISSKHHVQTESGTRRPSLESGLTSLGEKINYEEASTKAMAGSQYCDDKSVHTIGSGLEAGSYCDEAASTVALAGSVIDAKSLTDSTSGRMALHLCSRDRDLSPTSHHTTNVGELTRIGEEQQCSNSQSGQQEITANHSRDDTASCGSCKRRGRATSSTSISSGRTTTNRLSHSPHSVTQSCVNSVPAVTNNGECEEMILVSDRGVDRLSSRSNHLQYTHPTASRTDRTTAKNQIVLNSSANGSSTLWAVHASETDQSNADRFHIRALFDAMKQIVSSDVAAEPMPPEPVAQMVRPVPTGSRSNHKAGGLSKAGITVSNDFASDNDARGGHPRVAITHLIGGDGSSVQFCRYDAAVSPSSSSSSTDQQSSKRKWISHFLRKNRS